VTFARLVSLYNKKYVQMNQLAIVSFLWNNNAVINLQVRTNKQEAGQKSRNNYPGHNEAASYVVSIAQIMMSTVPSL
jgi:hypothetical protein